MSDAKLTQIDRIGEGRYRLIYEATLTDDEAAELGDSLVPEMMNGRMGRCLKRAPSIVGLDLRCERDRFHRGLHRATTRHGTHEWGDSWPLSLLTGRDSSE